MVFQVLKDTGFTYTELVELEYLGNEKIANKAGIPISYYEKGFSAAHGHFKDKDCLIKYLKAWVSILEENEISYTLPTMQNGESKVKEVIRYVAVSESLKEQAKELIHQQ